MARRYVRDSKGRFASTGSNRVYSQRAANTRLAGKYGQAIKKNDGDWELIKPNLPVKGVAPTKSTRRTSARMSNLYRGDIKGLRDDLELLVQGSQDKAMAKLTRDIKTGKSRMPKDERQARLMLQRRLRKSAKWSGIF